MLVFSIVLKHDN